MLIIRSQHVYFTVFHIFRILEKYMRFGSQLTFACGLRFLVDLYGRLEECCN
jgi:hypothetical protein